MMIAISTVIALGAIVRILWGPALTRYIERRRAAARLTSTRSPLTRPVNYSNREAIGDAVGEIGEVLTQSESSDTDQESGDEISGGSSDTVPANACGNDHSYDRSANSRSSDTSDMGCSSGTDY